MSGHRKDEGPRERVARASEGDTDCHVGVSRLPQSTADAPPSNPSLSAAAALAYARRGWSVFPVGGKRPLIKWGSEATTDAATIEAWWRRWPDAGVGIATGPSGLLVVDVDVKGGADGERSLDMLLLEHGDLPETREARTPSGGRHLYFRGSAASSAGRLGPGLDVRSAGGYVVAPPSEGYEWKRGGAAVDAPGWLLDLCGAPRAERVDRDAPAVEPDSPHALARVATYLRDDAEPAVEGDGGDDLTYRVACRVRDMGVSEAACLDLMAEHYSPRCSPPWPPDELGVKVGNAYRYAREREGAAAPEADFPDDLPPAEGNAHYDAPVGGFHRDLDRWVWIAGIKRYLLRSNPREMLDAQGFDSLHNHLADGRGASISHEAARSRTRMRKFRSVQYRPGGPEWRGEEYNAWRPGGVGPVEPRAGAAPWLVDHVRYLAGDSAGHVLDFLAHLVQRRGVKANFMLLMHTAAEGTGKDFLGALMGEILGPRNVTRPQVDEALGQFSDWALHAELVVISEVFPDRQRRTFKRIKDAVASPFARVHIKNVMPFDVENHTNYIAFTNHMDAFDFRKDTRRVLAVASDAEPRPQAYYDALWARLRDPAAVRDAAAELLARDLSGFNAKGRAPVTEHLAEMASAAQDPVVAWLTERLEAGERPFHRDLVTVDEVAYALRMEVGQHGSAAVGAARRFLREQARHFGQADRDGRAGRQVRLWSVRDHARYAAMTGAERARLHARYGASEREED